MMFFDPELFSAVSASLIPSTLRAHSTRVYWKPPQVATKGQSRRRANSMPFSIPSKLLYGLPGEAQSPSKPSSMRCEFGSRTEGVGIHCDSSFSLSLAAACCSASLVA